MAVPSTKRAAAIENYGKEAEESLKDEGDGWFATPYTPQASELVDDSPERVSRSDQVAQPAEANSDDDIPDIDDLVLDDDDVEVPFSIADYS